MAAAASSQVDAIDALHPVLQEREAQTVYLVLLILLGDVAWSPAFGGVDNAKAWVEGRRFALIQDRFDDG